MSLIGKHFWCENLKTEISSLCKACITRKTTMGHLYKWENILCWGRGGTKRHHKYFCQWRLLDVYNKTFLITWLAAMHISCNKRKFTHNKVHRHSLHFTVLEHQHSHCWGHLRGVMYVCSWNFTTCHFAYWRGSHVAVSVLLLYLRFSLSLSQFNPSLCHLPPFLLSYIAVSRSCHLSEFYLNRSSLNPLSPDIHLQIL